MRTNRKIGSAIPLVSARQSELIGHCLWLRTKS
jgi:hypothetical protein